MKKIYDEKTTALIKQLNDLLAEETNHLANKLKNQGATAMRIKTEIQCNSHLNAVRNELFRIHQIAMPVRYEFELEKE